MYQMKVINPTASLIMSNVFVLFRDDDVQFSFCYGDSNTWRGKGPCETYAAGQANHARCSDDMDQG